MDNSNGIAKNKFQSSKKNGSIAMFQRPNAKDRLPVTTREREIMKVPFMDFRKEIAREQSRHK